MNSAFRTLIIFSTLIKLCAGGGGQDPVADNCYNDWKGTSRIFGCNDFQQMFHCVTLNGCEHKGDSDFDCCLELVKNVNNLFSNNNPYALRCESPGVLFCDSKPHTHNPPPTPTPVPTYSPTPPTPTPTPTSSPTLAPVTNAPTPLPAPINTYSEVYMIIGVIGSVVFLVLTFICCMCCNKTDTDTDTKKENLIEPDCGDCGECAESCVNIV